MHRLFCHGLVESITRTGFKTSLSFIMLDFLLKQFILSFLSYESMICLTFIKNNNMIKDGDFVPGDNDGKNELKIATKYDLGWWVGLEAQIVN